MVGWGAFVLGAFGIIVAVTAVAAQETALVNGRVEAVTCSTGVLGGALFYRWGYRIASR